MIDQPKPTFEHDDSDMDSASIPAPLQPKPTTGEWTMESVKELVGVQALRIDYTGIATRIADAYNAAVKEAYQKGYEDGKQAR